MAFNQVTQSSLTPSRPAPAAPGKRDYQNALASSGYGSSFTVGTSSPSGSSYAASYSGIGGSPNRISDSLQSSHIVRCGIVSIKEDGLVSWLWRPKWLVLKEQTLSIHKSEVRVPFVLLLSPHVLRSVLCALCVLLRLAQARSHRVWWARVGCCSARRAHRRVRDEAHPLTTRRCEEQVQGS